MGERIRDWNKYPYCLLICNSVLRLSTFWDFVTYIMGILAYMRDICSTLYFTMFLSCTVLCGGLICGLKQGIHTWRVHLNHILKSPSLDWCQKSNVNHFNAPVYQLKDYWLFITRTSMCDMVLNSICCLKIKVLFWDKLICEKLLYYIYERVTSCFHGYLFFM